MTSVEVLEDRYAELATATRLRLPVFLALAIRDAGVPADLWEPLAVLRRKAHAFRTHRGELDVALTRNDLREAARVAKALRTDAENVLAIAGRATAAAAGAVVQEVAKGDVIGIATGIAAIEAASSQLLSSTAKDRALWRLRRPYLLWLNDIADEAKGITETLPDFARIWQIPENRQDVFGTRFAAMAQLQAERSRQLRDPGSASGPFPQLLGMA